jgi:glutamate 5-kinase
MRRGLAPGEKVVVKVGSSSLTEPSGGLDRARLDQVADQVSRLWDLGHPTVLVTSAAIAAGLPALGLDRRPTDVPGLQVAAAVGQGHLVHAYSEAFAARGRAVGQVLLTRDVLADRDQYVHSSEALERMLQRGVVPVVNENDVVVVDELRFGDNDRLAAIVSHLVGAGMLVLLTDTEGIFDGDPNEDHDASLVEAVAHTDDVLDRVADSASKGTYGSGGIATKVAAARMAAWSGIPTVVAPAGRPDAALGAVAGENIGTWVAPRESGLPARKLWIAFGLPSLGTITVDAGAAAALTDGGRSLLAVGVTAVEGLFGAGKAVEVVGPDGALVAKGRVRLSADEVRGLAGTRAENGVVVHRDDLVVL